MTPLSFWIEFHIALAVLLALEFLLARGLHNPRRKALWTVSIWALVAVAFAGVLARHYGTGGATQYLASYVLEQSLSIDNLFVFLLLFRVFRVDEAHQSKVLFWGVTGAMLMRGLFIAAGVGLLARFHWIEYVFAAILGYAAVRMMMPSHDTEETTPGWITWLTKWRPISMTTEHFFVHEAPAAGQPTQRMATMLFLALIAVEVTDVVFALDSIPAVLSITREPFLAYTSNIMAVMSLRSLYVLLALALSKLKYLHYGMGIVLLFAAAKMLAQDWLEIGPGISLAVIAGVLGLTIAASLLAAKPTSTN